MRTTAGGRRLIPALLLVLPFALALPAAARAAAQSDSTAPEPAGGSNARQGATATTGGPIDSWLDSLGRDPNGLALPRDAVRSGNRTVAAGETVSGSVAAWRGDLDILGTVDGDAVAVGGDVILHAGAAVHGDVLSVGGEVRNDGAVVGGEMRSLSALTVGPIPSGASSPPPTPAVAARRSVSLAVGWYLVLAVIGLAVVLFARGKLEVISGRIRHDFARSFFYGLLGQILFFPALVVTIVALAITVIGVLLIPFAIVGLVLAAAGALALGFLAMSLVIGDAAMRWRGAAAPGGRAQLLQFLLIGLSIYLVLWVLGGALSGAGAIGGIVRFVIVVVTWVAITVGFGATLASRGGTRAHADDDFAEPEPLDDQGWQTPTPVSGVAAARRPTPTGERSGRGGGAGERR